MTPEEINKFYRDNAPTFISISDAMSFRDGFMSAVHNLTPEPDPEDFSLHAKGFRFGRRIKLKA